MIRLNSFKVQRLLSIRYPLLIVMLIASSTSVAETLNITANFTPSPTSGGKNEFTNTTPTSGYCATYPGECKANNIFSVRLSFGAEGVLPIEADNNDQRKRAMLRMPGAWRKLQVTNSRGEVHMLDFRISGMGATQVFSDDVTSITGKSVILDAHDALWEGLNWVYVAPNCGASYSGAGAYTARTYRFFWKKNATDAICSKKARFRIPKLGFRDINIAYELRAPNPLAMGSGDYTGELNFSIGNGGDFDFGDQMSASDSNLKINFDLRVNHILDVRFPSNADILSLNPDGGWQQWLYRGRRPEKLSANQSFQIWSSGPFQMRLECQYPIGDQCGIQNKAGDLVPVETRLTLPNRLLGEAGLSVNRYLLNNKNPSIFHTSQYVGEGRAALDFEVSRDSVAHMINSAGSRYSGNVTIVLESEM